MKKQIITLILASALVFTGCASETISSSSSHVIDTQDETVKESVESDESEKEIDPKIEAQNALEDSFGIMFYGKLLDDKVGNLRTAVYVNAATVEDFAIDYYNAYFENDDEIHGVCNLGLNTTARIKVIDSNTLEVTTFEYVKSEEHYAESLFSGTMLTQSFVYIDSGEIERL